MSGPIFREFSRRRLCVTVALSVSAFLAVSGSSVAAVAPAGSGPKTKPKGWVVSRLPVVPNPEGYVVVTGTDGARTFTGRLGSKAVLWTPNRITVLGRGAAQDVNRRGDVVGYRNLTSAPESSVPTLWRRGRAITLALPRGAQHAYPESINDSGAIIGVASYAGSKEVPVLWSVNTPSRVRDLRKTFPALSPLVITGAGVVVGNSSKFSTALKGTLRTGLVALPRLKGVTSTQALDAACQYITGSQYFPKKGWQPVLWTNGRVQQLPNGPGQRDGQGKAVNCRGTVVGSGGWGSWVREPGAKPVLLPALKGGRYAGASEITDQGIIAGYSILNDDTVWPVIWTKR